MEENVYCEKVKNWMAKLAEIATLNSYDTPGSMITTSRNDSGISVSSSDNPYEKLVDELEKMYEEFGKKSSSTITSASISPEIHTYPTDDDYLKETYDPFIKPVDSKLTIDDKEHDAVEVKVVDASTVDTSRSGHGFDDWIIRGDPGITIIKDTPSVHFNDAVREGTRFVEAANTAPAPKPVPTKDTEFTRLWDKLDTI